MPFTILIGIVVGTLLAPVVILTANEVHGVYDRAYPIVEMQGKLISLANDEAVIALSGRKLRECSYVRIQAYSLSENGDLNDAFITRTDMPEDGESKPKGSFLFGSWRVWPLPNSHGIVVYANHLCGSRVVLTKIADIPLQGHKGRTPT